MRRLQNILITGATSGIGRHAALHLARRGHCVFATGRRTDRLESLEREAEGRDLAGIPMDVTDAESIDQARRKIDRLTDGHGVHVLVNNAGYGQPGPMETLSDEDLRRQFDTNVFGLMAVTRAFLPRMRERGTGRVINISSVVGHVSMPFLGAYCATKHAVEALSDAMRLELRPFGVDVVLIEPGAIRTEFTDRTEELAEAHVGEDSPYGKFIRGMRGASARHAERAPDPTCISRAIARAVESRRPRTRDMRPARDRLLIGLARALPTRWVDAMVARAMGLRPSDQ